jgi:hypothetical protein
LSSNSYAAFSKQGISKLLVDGVLGQVDLKQIADDYGSTRISIDRDGTAAAFSETPLVTLNDVAADLATLLANHQIVVSHG